MVLQNKVIKSLYGKKMLSAARKYGKRNIKFKMLKTPLFAPCVYCLFFCEGSGCLQGSYTFSGQKFKVFPGPYLEISGIIIEQ